MSYSCCLRKARTVGRSSLFCLIQDQKQCGGLRIGRAIESRWTEMHLERRDHVTGRNIQLAGLRRGITQASQLRLEPADARQLPRQLRLLTRHRLFVRPDPQAFGGQALPGEQRSRVELAQRRDIAVADDVDEA